MKKSLIECPVYYRTELRDKKDTPIVNCDDCFFMVNKGRYGKHCDKKSAKRFVKEYGDQGLPTRPHRATNPGG